MKKTTKHNILFDTKGMYNDMLNDHDRKYLCVRNKVRQNKVISLSGKCPCLICKNEVISEGNNYDYNERFYNCGSLICEECLNSLRCDICTAARRIESNYKIYTNSGAIRICRTCFRRQVKYCPCCGEPMLLKSELRVPISVPADFKAKEKEKINYEEWTYYGDNFYSLDKNIEEVRSFSKPIFMCQECLRKKYKKYLSVEKYINYIGELIYAPVFKGYNPGEQFYYPNLKSVPIEKTEDIIINSCADFNFASQIVRN